MAAKQTVDELRDLVALTKEGLEGSEGRERLLYIETLRKLLSSLAQAEKHQIAEDDVTEELGGKLAALAADDGWED